MSNDKPSKPLSDKEKQVTPLPNEVDPNNARAKVFVEMQKAKQRFKNK